MWSETAYISPLVSPRAHVASSKIAKSEYSGWYPPELMPSDTPPVPPSAVPTFAPLASFSCEPALVPHMTSQFVFGLTSFCSAVT